MDNSSPPQTPVEICPLHYLILLYLSEYAAQLLEDSSSLISTAAMED